MDEKTKETLFGRTKGDPITKDGLMEKIKAWYEQGGEVIFFDTDDNSYDWTDINENFPAWIDEVGQLVFKQVAIGVFFYDTKKTRYEVYDIIG